MSITTAYPLSWPIGWPRVPHRTGSQFGKHSIADCTAEILRQLSLLSARSIVISTNLQLRQDGLPKSNQSAPADPGAAVYFQLRKSVYREPKWHTITTDHVLACDKWTRVEDNLWAIGKHTEALRGQQRWGVGSIDQAFAGYTALPAAGETSGEAWWQVLSVPATANADAINQAYRAKARAAHPDTGGSDEAMSRLNAARDAGLKAAK
jgi:hypothetical protein